MNTAVAGTFSRNISAESEDHNRLNENNNFLSGAELNLHILGCASNDRVSQKKIYLSFYGYAMSICERYSNNYDDSLEIINDGFLKIFKKIHLYKPAHDDTTSSFKGWLKKIMIYTAIDHFRKNHKQRLTSSIDIDIIKQSTASEDFLDRISYDEIKRAIQQLTPGYRITFNLYIIEGFTHEEISKKLGISLGASKSNLARGKKQLQEILFREYQIKLDNKINACV